MSVTSIIAKFSMSLKTNIPILLKLPELFYLAKNKQKLKTGVFLQQEPGSEA